MDPFLENCGIRLLEVSVGREGEGEATVHRFPDRPFLLVGRDPRCDLCLDDERVSKRHAYLQAVGGRLFCADLGSRTGVHWPSGPRASGWVDWDEPLGIGGAAVRVARPRPDGIIQASPSADEPAAPRAAGRAVFEVTGGAGGPTAWTMKGSVALIGGAAACKVRLPDPRVSRFHCSLVRGPLGVCVVDLLSRTGTQVGGQSLPWACLQDGDRLQVGPYEFRLRFEPPDRGDDRRLAPRAPADRALLAPSATIDRALLLPVLNEFNQMQQQMLDQFHQTMLMMAEMFTSLHKEQAELVREELGHLRRLTRELNTLQAEQAKQSAAGRFLPPPLEGPAAAESAAVEEGRPGPQDVPEVEDAAIAAKAAPEGAPGKPAPADVHDWLARRVDQLQAERQGRWQKLMRLVTGR